MRKICLLLLMLFMHKGLNCFTPTHSYTQLITLMARSPGSFQGDVKLSQMKPTLNHLPKTSITRPFQASTATIYVESWRKGERDIQEQTITVELGPNRRGYEAVISSKSETAKYILGVDFELYGLAGPRIERYKVSLSESNGVPRLGKQLFKYNLLMQEEPSSGKHYFPKEDSVGEFFPLEEIPFFKYGFNGFPVSAKRVIKVEGFYCIIQAVSYKISTEKPGVFDSLTLQIEFRNKY